MSLGNETNIPAQDARNAQASAAGCCVLGLAACALLAFSPVACARLVTPRPDPAPYSLCERCGRLLDGAPAACVPESEARSHYPASRIQNP